MPDHESRITNHKSQITNPWADMESMSEYGIRPYTLFTNHKSRITNHESRITNHAFIKVKNLLDTQDKKKYSHSLDISKPP